MIRTHNADTQKQHHYVPPKKVTQIAAELKELQEEKRRILGALRQLKAQKVQNMINDQSDEDEDDYDFSASSSSSSSSSSMEKGHHRRRQRQKQKQKQHFMEDDVSSLHSHTSRALHVGESDDSDNDDDDDASFVTGGNYDARGHHYHHNDDKKGSDEVGTVVAHYQNQTGNSNTPMAIKPNNNNDNQIDGKSPPPVLIEWSRGLRTYVPKANLAYSDDYLYQCPDSADISLMVAKDDDVLEKSYFSDDLSFSSGEDPYLIAAVTDMPLKIDVDMQGGAPGHDNNGDGDDNASVMSGLHSEWDSCSISIMNMPPPTAANNNKNLLGGGSSRSKTAAVPALLSSPGGKSKQKRGKQRQAQQQQQQDEPPNEISCSDLSLESINSLGSELGGVSQHKWQERSGEAEGDPTEHNRKTKDISSKNKKSSSEKRSKKKSKKAKEGTEQNYNNNKTNNNSASPAAAAATEEDGLSADDLAVVQKREKEMIKKDSGDERPLHHVSRRKKRRSLDAIAGAKVTVAIAAATAKGSSSRGGKKRRQKRTQSKPTDPAGTTVESSKSAVSPKGKPKDRVSRSGKTKE